jgi:hypothetical protein
MGSKGVMELAAALRGLVHLHTLVLRSATRHHHQWDAVAGVTGLWSFRYRWRPELLES